MELLKQCQLWFEQNEIQQIIDTLEAIPAGERTPELDSELAKAYIVIADTAERKLFKKALGLLEPHEEYFAEDHCWNYRIACAYYYLDEEGPALHYFENALKARPGDEDTLQYIDACRHRLALPRFEKNFRERTREAWEAFAQTEAELRQIMDTDKMRRRSGELIEKCGDALNPALPHSSFELGFNGEKYELILSPEGLRSRLFPLVYFRSQAPESVLKYWDILVGRQPSEDFELQAGDIRVNAGDVQMWTEKIEERQVRLTLYCEKLTPLLKENPDRVWWALSLLLDQVIGEVSSIASVTGFDVCEEPKDEPSMPLSRLPDILQNMGIPFWRDSSEYLENSYLTYELEPVKDPEADWRLDIYIGACRLPAIINDYLNAQSSVADTYHRDGIAAGFFAYPLSGFTGAERGREILDFRDELEEAILDKAGAEAVTFLGGATGLYHGYLDFIAWDLPAVLQAAREFFEKSDLSHAYFHTFRRDVGGVPLLDEEESEPENAIRTSAGDSEPELYTEEEISAVEEHIKKTFGEFDHVFHELFSPDIHVDICIVPPSGERDYYTLVTMGMGAHRMNVPEELAEYRLERAELAIALPSAWKLDEESMKDDQWYWPLRLLKDLARLPVANDTWLGFGHTMDNQEAFAENTKQCGAILVSLQNTDEAGNICSLPGGEEVNFYQVIPLYRDELEYKLEHDADALLDRMAGVSFVVQPDR